MLESSKTRNLRGAQFFRKYFSKTVLDIGCGEDLVVPHAQPFELAHGDANNILNHLKPMSFDTVNSSHCLEHMHNPPKVLQDWWKLVKPGGYLVTVVPHEDLYEQGQWPSRFNHDHKATFRFKTQKTWSPCSFDAYRLHESLAGASILEADIQADKYNYKLMKLGQETDEAGQLRIQMFKFMFQLRDKKKLTLEIMDELNIFYFGLGAVVDQTMGSALAQIQMVVQKSA